MNVNWKQFGGQGYSAILGQNRWQREKKKNELREHFT